MTRTSDSASAAQRQQSELGRLPHHVGTLMWPSACNSHHHEDFSTCGRSS